MGVDLVRLVPYNRADRGDQRGGALGAHQPAGILDVKGIDIGAGGELTRAVGDPVTPDTVIGIIEVMKLMNPVHAGIAGTVVAMLADNSCPVEAGQPLLRVRTA
jgi:hypothetical protein